MESDLSHEALRRFSELEDRVKALEDKLVINDEDDEELELETEE